ncbi:MAG: efflux RND transporter periplasmic adaptor subunit [Candidatus Limivivens sp.]|nr:efflux RND transporter periplasmic adaptor subunit [Candidatus Limivivens sp.]
MKKKKKGFLIVFFLLLLAAAVGFIIWFIRNQDSRSDEGSDTVFVDSVATLTGLGSTGVIQRFAGVVEPQKTWNVENSSDKKVKEMFVEVGDEVQVGQELFAYDTTDAEESLIEGEIEIDRLNGDIENYNAQITSLQADKAKAGADEQLDYATQIQSIQNSLKKAQYDLQKQQVTNENLKKNIANSTVTSELNGIVKSINNTDNSSSYSYSSDDESNYLMTIVAVGQYRIKGTLNEQNRSSLAEGSPVIVHSRVDEDQIWRGYLSEIDYDNPVQNTNNYYYGVSDSSTQSSNYPFYVELDSIDGLIMGQHVYIEMDYGQADQKSGMWLNSYYIVQDDGDPYVWAANSKDKIEKRRVTLGEYDEDQDKYEILDGLTAEDYIAFPNGSIKEGDPAEKNINQTSDYYTGDEDYADDIEWEDWEEDSDYEDLDWEEESDMDFGEFETDTDFFDEFETDVDFDEDYEDGTESFDDELLIEDYTEEDIGDGSAPVSAELEEE